VLLIFEDLFDEWLLLKQNPLAKRAAQTALACHIHALVEVVKSTFVTLGRDNYTAIDVMDMLPNSHQIFRGERFSTIQDQPILLFDAIIM
jgi:hypothetical protein